MPSLSGEESILRTGTIYDLIRLDLFLMLNLDLLDFVA